LEQKHHTVLLLVLLLRYTNVSKREHLHPPHTVSFLLLNKECLVCR